MLEQHANQESVCRGLPQFPSESDDGLIAPLPDRTTTWGKIGALNGAIVGGLIGICGLVEALISGTKSLTTSLYF